MYFVSPATKRWECYGVSLALFGLSKKFVRIRCNQIKVKENLCLEEIIVLFLSTVTLIVEIIVLWLPFSSTVSLQARHISRYDKNSKCFAAHYLRTTVYNRKESGGFTKVNSVTPNRSDITSVLIPTDLKLIVAFGKHENTQPDIVVLKKP